MTLDEIAERPALASGLPADAVEALLVRHAAVGQVLLGRLLATRGSGSGSAEARPEERPSLLTIQDAAARIAVPPSRIKEAIRAGKLRSQKIGHYRRIRPEWLEEFLRAEERSA